MHDPRSALASVVSGAVKLSADLSASKVVSAILFSYPHGPTPRQGFSALCQNFLKWKFPGRSVAHSRIRVRLSGNDTRALLARGAAVDFARDVFTPASFAQTTIHQIPVLALVGGDGQRRLQSA